MKHRNIILILLCPLVLAVGFVFATQQAGLCHSVFPFAEVVSVHRISVTDDEKFVEKMEQTLTDQGYSFHLRKEEGFRRPTTKGFGRPMVVYKIAACKRQAIVITSNSEKQGQHIVTFHQNWLFGDSEAQKTKMMILESLNVPASNQKASDRF